MDREVPVGVEDEEDGEERRVAVRRLAYKM
jgi:adenosine/AMP kinase